MSEPAYPVHGPFHYASTDDDLKCLVRFPDGTSSYQELFAWDGPRVDWCAELGIPYMDEPEQLEAMARPRGFGPRGFECVLLDESPTRFAGAWRHRVREITYRDGGHYALTLSHTGMVIGAVGGIRLAGPGEVDGAEGDHLVAQARLYDSELADRAWDGMLSGIFAAVCAVIAREPTAPVGTGELVEVALADVVGVPGARITKLLQETPAGMMTTRLRVPICELPADAQRAIAMHVQAVQGR